jgi:hypothetical protein
MPQKIETQGRRIVSNTIIKRLKRMGYRIQTVTFVNDMGFANHMGGSKSPECGNLFYKTVHQPK